MESEESGMNSTTDAAHKFITRHSAALFLYFNLERQFEFTVINMKKKAQSTFNSYGYM